jgi:hypothetical protein
VADRTDESARGLSALEDELRAVHARIDQVRDRMRKATDVFGLLGFGLAFVGLLVVASLAGVSFAKDDKGVGMLFAALTVVALPIVAIAAWHAFNRLWSLSRELSTLRRREATIFGRLETVREPDHVLISDPAVDAAPAGGLGGLMGGFGRGPRRVDDRLPPGRSADGFRVTSNRNRQLFGRTAALWLLGVVGVLFLIFIVGVALGSATIAR